MKADGSGSAGTSLREDSALIFLPIIYFNLLLLKTNLKSIGFCGFAFNAPQLDGKEKEKWAKKRKISDVTTDNEADVTQ